MSMSRMLEKMFGKNVLVWEKNIIFDRNTSLMIKFKNNSKEKRDNFKWSEEW